MGREIRLARVEQAMTRVSASRRAGVSPDTERRVEVGEPGVSISTLCAVGQAVGIDIVLRAYRARPIGLRDSGQLSLAELIRGLATPHWTVAFESPAGDHGEACDVVLYGPLEIIDIEIDRRLVDFQAQYRRNVLKRDYLAARHQRPVRLVMAIEDTRRNRAALEPHAQLVAAAIPGTSRDVLRAIRTGRPLGADGLLWIRRRRIAQTVA